MRLIKLCVKYKNGCVVINGCYANQSVWLDLIIKIAPLDEELFQLIFI